MGTQRHVVPDGEGHWKVVGPHAERASATARTQAEAERRAKEIVGNAGGGEVEYIDLTAPSAIPIRSRREGTHIRRSIASTNTQPDHWPILSACLAIPLSPHPVLMAVLTSVAYRAFTSTERLRTRSHARRTV